MAKTIKEQIREKSLELAILSLEQKLVDDEIRYQEQKKKTKDEIKELKAK